MYGTFVNYLLNCRIDCDGKMSNFNFNYKIDLDFGSQICEGETTVHRHSCSAGDYT